MYSLLFFMIIKLKICLKLNGKVFYFINCRSLSTFKKKDYSGSSEDGTHN